MPSPARSISTTTGVGSVSSPSGRPSIEPRIQVGWREGLAWLPATSTVSGPPPHLAQTAIYNHHTGCVNSWRDRCRPCERLGVQYRVGRVFARPAWSDTCHQAIAQAVTNGILLAAAVSAAALNLRSDGRTHCRQLAGSKPRGVFARWRASGGVSSIIQRGTSAGIKR